MLAAYVGGLLLYSAPLRAADPTAIACPNSQTVFLEGQAPPGEAVLAYLEGRPVGGGLADASGRYRVPLRAQERPGAYSVEVRLRSSPTLVGAFTCFVDIPLGAELTPTTTLTAATPVTGATSTVSTSPIISRTSATATRTRVTSSPTGTAPTTTGTAGTPTVNSTLTATLGTTTPTVTGTTAVSSTVNISDIYLYDSAFPDEPEYVEIENTSSSPIDISGWRLSNLTRTGTVPAFTFPSFTLEGFAIIYIYSNEDDVESGEFNWNQSTSIWNVGDIAELRDSQNRLITTTVVPAQ